MTKIIIIPKILARNGEIMLLREAEIQMYVDTANSLKGSEKRMFMARVVRMLGKGGQRLAEKEFGWNRGTVRKGMQELERGKPFVDKFNRRGRKRTEEKLPQFLPDLQEVMERLIAEDGLYQRTRFYTSVSVPMVRQHLVRWKAYQDRELPSNETIRRRLNDLNYRLKRI